MEISDKLYDVPQERRGTSRRNFIKYAGALAASLALPSVSYAQNKSPAVKPEKVSALEFEADKTILVDTNGWINHNELGREYNELSVKYMETLMKKGKYNPKKKKQLVGFMTEQYASSETRVKNMKKALLREANPEEYAKTYIKDPKKIEEIKNETYPELRDIFSNNFKSQKTSMEKVLFVLNWRRTKATLVEWLCPIKVNESNVDDFSNKIILYEGLRDLRDFYNNQRNMPRINIGPISGNSLVR